MRPHVLTLAGLLLSCTLGAQTPVYDHVILNGRVMDPESGVDAIRTLGIRSTSIAAMSTAPLQGRDTIDARGLVVAPGFIDMHVHWQSPAGYRFAALDGVTTALEAEGGVWPVPDWYQERAGKSLINFGATVSHGGVRGTVVHSSGTLADAKTGQDTIVFNNPWAYQRATAEQITEIQHLIERGLDEGALGIGLGLAYTPAAGRDEILRVFQTGAHAGVTSFVHVRHAGLTVNQGSIDAAQEVIADAAATGAALHIVHVTSTGLRETPVVLELIQGARQRGVDVTTELYPYEAASTDIQAAIFDPGWQARLGVKEDAILYVKTGERLTPETFQKYRRMGGPIVIFLIPKDAMYAALKAPGVMIGSDGVEIINNTGHPRGAGTYARVLGRLVRDEQVIPLMDALRRMTLLPARRLQAYAPAMRRKGRLKVGADADITVFDPATVMDRATFEQPEQASTGIPFVLVNGVPVVRNGKVVDGVAPGIGITRVAVRPSGTTPPRR
ncbi:MAG: amidohydrolase family protein [Gemmatimonadaceae bacterium]